MGRDSEGPAVLTPTRLEAPQGTSGSLSQGLMISTETETQRGLCDLGPTFLAFLVFSLALWEWSCVSVALLNADPNT